MSGFNPNDIISNSALSVLPFKDEPFEQWDKHNDLWVFVENLYKSEDEKLAILMADEHFSRSITTGKKWIDKFYEGSFEKSSAINIATVFESPPAFGGSKNLGLVLKYSAAWEICIQSILEESLFHSISNILESADELDCSLLLCSNCFYKQANQILRNYIEGILMDLYFSLNPEDFKNWKIGNFRTPKIRGKNGILDNLVNMNIIDNNLKDQFSILYDELNGYVHGSEKYLTFTGAFSGKHTGRHFKNNEFEKWCKLFSEAILISINILKITCTNWYLSNKDIIHKYFCAICHNNTFFSVSPDNLFPNTDEVVCLVCRNKTHCSVKN